MKPRNLLAEWARLLVESLASAGIRELVISPGSRSTPFTWAALKHPKLRCRVLIDERSAGFYALGQARVTGTPSALLCTSGSALANYFPAVVEAAESGTPLVIVSADRPTELQGCGAAQTIDQVKLFGGYVRHFVDLGTPDESPAALQALVRSVAQSVRAAQSPSPGPVHLNARARKPLEPEPARSADELELQERVSSLIERGPTRSFAIERLPDPDALELLARACRATERGVIVCGPSPIPASLGGYPPELVLELGELTGYPLLCEAASQARFAAPAEASVTVCDAFDALCRSSSFCAQSAPELIVQLGRPPTSTGLEQYLARHSSAPRWVLAPHAWPDPLGGASALVTADLAPTLRALCERLRVARSAPWPAPPSEWRKLWSGANALAWQVTDEELSAAGSALTEAVAVRTVVDALEPGSLLALGNSLPIREVDAFCPARGRGLHVAAQRGANGIDGLISSSAGAASVAQTPTTLLIGDVSFLHDVGGLYAVRELDHPLTVVVLNNGGGRIFEQLPIAGVAREPRELSAWLTPHGLELEHASRLFGLPYRAARTGAELRAALAERTPGARVIEVIVADPSVTHQLRSIWSRLEARLRAPLGPEQPGSR